MWLISTREIWNVAAWVWHCRRCGVIFGQTLNTGTGFELEVRCGFNLSSMLLLFRWWFEFILFNLFLHSLCTVCVCAAHAWSSVSHQEACPIEAIRGRLSECWCWVSEQACFDSCFLRMLLFLSSRFLGCFSDTSPVRFFRMSGC